jgi:hypothetical protein
MASVGEVRAHLSSAVMRAGEGIGALQQAREFIGGAIEAFEDAGNSASAAFEGSGTEYASAAMTLFIEAESDARAMMAKLEEALEAASGGNENCETYMGGM